MVVPSAREKRQGMIRKKNGFVLLGDIIDSRKIKNRAAFEQKMAVLIPEIGNQYKKYCLAPLKAQKGIDEAGAVLKDRKVLYKLITHINNELYPQQMRFAICEGVIDSGLNSNDVSQMDGPAFHTAAAVMSRLKDEKLLVLCETADTVFDKSLENQINAMAVIKNSWTSKQMEIYTQYKSLLSQDLVAKKLNTTQQNISKQMAAINGFSVLKIEENIQKLMEIF